MSRNILRQVNKDDWPEIPRQDYDWRSRHPAGSLVRICEYQLDTGWCWKTYRVVRYFPHVVMCQDRRGFIRCFGSWEFQRRQKGRLDSIKGGGSHRGIENRIGDG